MTDNRTIQQRVADILAGHDTSQAVLPKNFIPQNNNVPQLSNSGYSAGSSGGGGPGIGTSIFHHILDYLGRGNAASAGAFLGGFAPQNSRSNNILDDYSFSKAWKGFEVGLTGETHHTFGEVLKQHGHTGIGMGTLGVGLDIAADPTTYLGAGIAGKVIKGSAKAAEAAGIVGKAAPALEGTIEGGTKILGSAPVRRAIEAPLPKAASVERINGAIPMPGGAATAPIADIIAPRAAKKAATAVADTSPFVREPFVGKTFDNLTAKETAQIEKDALSRSKSAFEAHPLSRTAVTTDAATSGFKGHTWAEIKSDPTLLKSLIQHPDFQQIHAANYDAAENSLLSKVNAKNEIIHNTNQDILQATHNAAPAAVAPTLPINAGAAHAIMESGPIIGDVAHPSARVLATQQGLSAEELRVAENSAKNQASLIDKNPAYSGQATAAAQTNMHNVISNELNKATRGRLKYNDEIKASIDRTYTHAEAILESKGYNTVKGARPGEAFDASAMRLSNVLPHLSPTDVVKKNYLTQVMTGTSTTEAGKAAHDAAVAAGHIDDAAKINPVIEQVGAKAEQVSNSVQAIKDQAEFVKEAPKAAGTEAAGAGASHVGQQTARIAAGEAADHMLTNPIVATRVASASSDARALATGVIDPVTAVKKAEAVDKYLGLKIHGTKIFIPVLPATKMGKGVGTALNLTRGADGLLKPAQGEALGRLSTYVQRADTHFHVAFDSALGMTPDMHAARQAGVNATGARVLDDMNILSKLRSPVSRKVFNDAYRSAQDGNLTDPLAQKIHSFMDNIYNTDTGYLKAAQVVPTALKSTLAKQFGKDTIPLVTDAAHHPFDTWRTLPVADGKGAEGLMAKHAAAAQQAVGYKTLQTSALHTFGSLTEKPGFNSRVAGALGWYPPDVAQQLDKMLKTFNPEAITHGPLLNAYDKVLRGFKTGMTKFMPGHHINNSLGQLSLMFNDGVTDLTKWHVQAAKALAGRDGAINPIAERLIAAKADDPVLLSTKFGNLTAHQAWNAFSQSGVRQAHATADDLEKTSGTLNSISRSVGTFSNERENIHRMAHFLYAIKNPKTATTMDDAVKEAATRVNTIHGDYSDLTQFERNVARRLIPFYTWQRKVGPIVFKQMMVNPGRTMVYPKIMGQVGRENGMAQNGGFPSPTELVPSYLRDLLQVKTGTAADGNSLYGGPRLPFSDVVGKYTNNPVAAVADSMTPLKLLAETISGYKGYNTDKPTDPFSVGKLPAGRLSNIEDSVPYLSTLKRITRRDPANGFAPTKDANKFPDQQGTNITALINLLTAGGIQENNSSAQRTAARENAKK